MDSRVTDHIYNSLQGFQLSRRLNEEQMYLTLEFTARIAMQAIGDVTLVLENNKHLELKDYFYVLDSSKILVLVSSINKSNYLVYFNKNVFIRKKVSFICSGMLVDNPFCIIVISLFPTIENNHVSLKRKVPNSN